MSAYKVTTPTSKTTSDGSTAAYYELPPWALELADLIRYKEMNGSQAEMFRALYRGSEASHSDEQRQAKKILAYAVDEIVRTHFPGESMKGFRDRVFDALFDGTPADDSDRWIPLSQCLPGLLETERGTYVVKSNVTLIDGTKWCIDISTGNEYVDPGIGGSTRCRRITLE